MSDRLAALKPDVSEEEEVVQGLVVGEVENVVCQNPAMPPAAQPFDVENGEDEAGALREACRSLEKLEWDDNDLAWYFNRCQTRMKIAGVKKQFTKFQVMSEILPTKVQNEIKTLLRKEEADFPNNNAYKLLKTEVFRIFGQRPEVGMERALNRVLAGKPSQLARQLVSDMCRTELDNCQCCAANISALWRRHLPGNVRAGIASMKFDKDNFEAILTRADDIFDSNTPSSAASVAAVKVVPAPSADETLPAIPYPQPEVAAMRGGGRGGRGGRGNRGSRGNRGGRGAASGGAQSSGQPRHKGTKHPDLPAGEWRGCQMHFRWGKSAFFCAEPLTCPWKDFVIPKPSKNN